MDPYRMQQAHYTVMKTLVKIFPIIVSSFLILLFIDASASKMLDFENFQVQLAHESPHIPISP